MPTTGPSNHTLPAPTAGSSPGVGSSRAHPLIVGIAIWPLRRAIGELHDRAAGQPRRNSVYRLNLASAAPDATLRKAWAWPTSSRRHRSLWWRTRPKRTAPSTLTLACSRRIPIPGRHPVELDPEPFFATMRNLVLDRTPIKFRREARAHRRGAGHFAGDLVSAHGPRMTAVRATLTSKDCYRRRRRRSPGAWCAW